MKKCIKYTNNPLESYLTISSGIHKQKSFLDFLLEVYDDKGKSISIKEIRQEVDTFIFSVR